MGLFFLNYLKQEKESRKIRMDFVDEKEQGLNSKNGKMSLSSFS